MYISWFSAYFIGIFLCRFDLGERTIGLSTDVGLVKSFGMQIMTLK